MKTPARASGDSFTTRTPTLLLALAATFAAGLSGCASKHAAHGSDKHAEKSATAVPARTKETAPRQNIPDLTRKVEFARDRVFPSLVNITVITVSYWGGTETKGGSTGSGTIISPDGLIVTNHHVVEDGKTFKVTLADKREATATLVGDDPMTDLAVLRINMKDLGENTTLPVASFGNSDELQVGDYVIAMGAPYGLSRSVTLGVVSNTERVFTGMSGDDIADQEFDFDVSSDIFTRWIQHDALILPGNSGGPLVNLQGEIIGVNTRGGSGLGFANPTSLVKYVVDNLIAHGEVPRSTIGANFKSVKRAGFQEGVLINSVNENGPADKAGLKAGDVMLAINGQSTSARFPEEIPLVLRKIAEKPVGTSLDISYKRDGQVGTAKVTTEKLLKERGDETALRLFGLSVSQITDKMARNRNFDSTQGALVIGVKGGSPAEIAEPSLTWGDVIKSMDGVAINSLEDLVNQYKVMAAKDPLPEFVTIEFDRNGKNQLTLIKPRPEKRDDPPRELPKGWIGIATQPILKDLAKQMGLGDQVGFRVTRIYPGTLASNSGLQVGDVITKVNGEAMAPRGMQDAGMMQRRVRQLGTSGEATLTVLRNKQPVDVKVPLERTRITAEEALRDSNRDFEMSVRELTFFDRDDNRWDESVNGVMVVSVERVGWAGLAGMVEGDVIQRINNEVVTDLTSYRKAMEKISKEQPERVAFFVQRGNRTQFKFAEPEWKPTTDKAEEKK
ncbi:MAG TPA: PDZ domain-containing protein [Phycisphaerales bacterium]|nr:PDZ domain-containing protein [Phycisphaerales bacterium]